MKPDPEADSGVVAPPRREGASTSVTIVTTLGLTFCAVFTTAEIGVL